jgi:hypothetical protein
MDNGKQIKATSFQLTHSQQVIGREAETATLLSRCLFTFGGLGGGFRPRQRRRWASSFYPLVIMKLLFCFSLLFFLLFSASDSFACSCSPRIGIIKSEQQLIEEARENAKAVFSGEVTKIILSDAPKDKEPLYAEVHFKIIQSWKGITTEEATVYTAHICCICGFPFKVGRQYLVYAYGDKNLATNICTRTMTLKYASKDLKFLGEAEKTFIEEKKKKQKRAKE